MRPATRFLPLSLAFVLSAAALPAPAEPAAPPPSCGRGTGPVLGELACELAKTFGSRASGALVAGSVPGSEDSVAPRPELASRLAELVAGALGPAATPYRTPVRKAEAASLPFERRPLLLVSARIEEDRIAVTADLFPNRPNLWQRLKGTLPGPAAHAFAERGLDAEVRSYLPRIPLVVSRIDRAVGSDADTVAVACGDADADGSIEVAALGRRRLTLGRLRGGRFEVFRARALAELVPIAPAPFREPIASAWIPEPGVLEIGSTDRARALRLGPKLEILRELDGRLPWPGGGCAEAEGTFIRFSPAPCEAGPAGRATRKAGAHERFPNEQSAKTELDAIAGAVLVTGSETRSVRARRRAGDGAVLLSDQKRAVLLANAGAQLAVGDLDGDGQPELATSLDTLDPAADAIAVHSLSGQGTLVERFRVPVPSGVRAIGTCPPRLGGMAEIVVATGDGLWVIR